MAWNKASLEARRVLENLGLIPWQGQTNPEESQSCEGWTPNQRVRGGELGQTLRQ